MFKEIRQDREFKNKTGNYMTQYKKQHKNKN